MNNGELRTQDWVNSLMFAINGSVIQKQFKPLSREAKADLLVNSFKEYGMTKPEALNVLKTMDDISAGKIRVRKTNDVSSHPTAGENVTLLPEVEVNAPRVGNPAVTSEVGKAEATKAEATKIEVKPLTKLLQIQNEIYEIK